MAKHVTILGFGVTGESAARHFLAQGATVTVVDTRPERAVPQDLAAATYLWRSTQFPAEPADIVVVSPGLSMNSCLLRSAQAAGVPLLSDIDVFLAAARAPVIGITGTNGKSTVTSLVGHLLKEAGFQVGVGGNLGEAALSLLRPDVDFYVLELSSFQLERSDVSKLDRAAILNVTEDHIDQHGSLTAYADAKRKIYAGATLRVFNRTDDTTKPRDGAGISFASGPPNNELEWGIVDRDDDQWIARGDVLLQRVADLPLGGLHNATNVMAACALVAGLVSDAQISAALRSYEGLPHRFETVLEIAEVTYVDDSKATNVGATVAALEGLEREQRVVLIAGGDAKGAELGELRASLGGHARAVVTLGKDGPQIAALARELGIPFVEVSTMTESVRVAAGYAQPGDIVLLSPACSSLDMFASFDERGRLFQEAVSKLDDERAT
ncbi:MAG: UDP-N-acetylmuramoyl-L-alanine--D-glutamate ligase [Pseudomonadales bacterium]|nr:UDP-N-acetylmuramoyl-L-alanine--D-glutamate ligase [Pseudomonadales bacterium]